MMESFSHAHVSFLPHSVILSVLTGLEEWMIISNGTGPID